jgi:hypothetical protein
VREADASEFGRHAVAKEESLSGWLVVAPRGIKLGRNQDLAGVVEDNAYPNELLIDRHVQASESCEEKLTCFANEGNMLDQPRRSAESFQQGSGSIGRSRIQVRPPNVPLLSNGRIRKTTTMR